MHYHFLYLKVTLTHSWESQSRNNRLLRYLTNGTNDVNIPQTRKKSSDTSLSSPGRRHSIAQCSESLINLHVNNNRMKREDILRLKDPIYRKQKKHSYPNDPVNLAIISKYNRRYSEGLSTNQRKSCLKVHKNSPSHRGRPLHYVTYKYDQNKSNPTLPNNQAKNSTQQQQD